MLPIINIFGYSVGSYAVLSFLGFIVCGIVVYFSCRNLKIEIEDIAILELVVAAGLLFGGHLLYGITNISEIANAFKTLFEVEIEATVKTLSDSFGGMVFYGGFLGGIASLKIYIHFTKAKFKSSIMDIYAFSIPLFHFFGRIGCFLAGCCYGIESKFGFIVNNNTLVPSINGVRRFPVALFEAVSNIIIFYILLKMFKRGLCKNKLLYLYMIFYSSVRFFTEFLRGDSIRGIYLGVSTSQWISIYLFTVGTLTMVKTKYTEKTRRSRK